MMNNSLFFKLAYLQKKKEENQSMLIGLRVTGALVALAVFICSLLRLNDGFTWGISLLIIAIITYFDIHCIYQVKKIEFEIYRLQVKDREDKKKIAEIRGEILPDAVLNQKIKAPAEKVYLPITYYGLLAVLEILSIILIMI